MADGRLRPTLLYVGGLCGAAVVALVGWALLFGASSSWAAVGASGVLTLTCAVFRRFPVRLGRATIEVVEVPILAALVLAGPLWALLVAVPSVLYREKLRMAFTAATHGLAFLGAGYAYGLFAEPLLFSAGPQPGLAYGVVAAGLAFHALDDLFGAGVLRVKHGTPVAESFREIMLPAVPGDAAAVLAVLCAAWSFSAYGPVAPLALFAGAALAVALLHLVRGHREGIEALKARNAELEVEAEGALGAPLVFASRLVESLELRDGRTARHAAASALYAADVAKELGLKSAGAEKLRVAALLQNVGLASVPDEVLLTPPGKLNSVGRMTLEEHPVRGERMLSGVPGFEEAAKWVRWHHEREDGTGYPDRLRGRWIPLEAKVLAATGLYASLVLDGPNKPGISPQEARRELAGLAGGCLDETVVRTFLRVLDAQDHNYAAAADARFAFSADSAGRGTSADGRPTPLKPTGTTEVP